MAVKPLLSFLIHNLWMNIKISTKRQEFQDQTKLKRIWLTSGWKEALWLFRWPLCRKASLQPAAGHLKLKSYISNQRAHALNLNQKGKRKIPICPVLEMDPSVLFQASSINEALTTLRTWMRLDPKVRLQVPELKNYQTVFNSKKYLARSYCFLKLLSQWTQGRERWRVPDSWAATWDRYLLAIYVEEVYVT